MNMNAVIAIFGLAEVEDPGYYKVNRVTKCGQDSTKNDLWVAKLDGLSYAANNIGSEVIQEHAVRRSGPFQSLVSWPKYPVVILLRQRTCHVPDWDHRTRINICS